MTSTTTEPCPHYATSPFRQVVQRVGLGAAARGRQRLPSWPGRPWYCLQRCRRPIVHMCYNMYQVSLCAPRALGLASCTCRSWTHVDRHMLAANMRRSDARMAACVTAWRHALVLHLGCCVYRGASRALHLPSAIEQLRLTVALACAVTCACSSHVGAVTRSMLN